MNRLATMLVVPILTIGLFSGCHRGTMKGPTVEPAKNITGTYELKGFTITTTPGTAGGGQETGTFLGNLKIGTTITEKDVASSSGTLKVGRNSWSYQISISGKVKGESGDYTLTYTAPNRATAIITTPTEKSARQIDFDKMNMTVTQDTTVRPDGSTLKESYRWKKINDAF